MQNLELYLYNDTRIFSLLGRIHRQENNRGKDLQKQQAMLSELQNISESVLQQADVSKREWDSIKLLLDIDKDIFHEESKIHMTNHIRSQNSYSSFVDFTRLPEDIPKKAKDLLYRPQKMAKLGQAYNRLVAQLEEDYASKKLAKEQWEAQKHERLRFHGRITKKKDDEVDMIRNLCEKLD